jgi:predicted anti-sigma-YlaC factor YlaD
MTADSCTAARTWLSDTRDGHEPCDEGHDDHLATCADCQGWVSAFDRINRTVRLRSPRPTSAARTRILTATRNRHVPERDRVSTVVLAVAAVGMVAAFGLAAAGIFGHSHLGTPEGRDSEALMLSLAGGYALAAWRPARLAPGLLPVALLAGLVTTFTSIAALTAGTTTLVSELSHVPLLLGTLGALRAARPFFTDAVRAPRPIDPPELVGA